MSDTSITWVPARRVEHTRREEKEKERAEREEKEELKLEDLFNYGRIKTHSPLLFKLLLLFYLPLGLLLFTIRLLLFILVCVSILIIPREIGDKINIPLVRIICGLIVKHNYNNNIPLANEPYLIAGNHVADFDTFAMWMVMPRFHTVTGAHLKAIPILGRVYSRLDAIFVAPNPESRSQLKASIQKAVATDPNPVLIFPEGGLTNGRVGTMMYHRFVFSLGCAIVPAAISLNDPWPVNHDYLGSTWTRNFIWFLILPFHVFEITFLPPQKREEGESIEEFAFRVQKMTSDYLHILPSYYSYSEKKELWKKISERKKKE